VFAQTPYYYLSPEFANLNPSISFFNASYELSDLEDNILEVVIAPNNPDGTTKPPFYWRSKQLYDLVFYWPSYTRVTQAYGYDTMIFSMSKMSGHAGSRLGWALVRNPQVANLMGRYVYISTHGVTLDAQYRALITINDIVSDKGEVFSYVSKVLKNRWDELISIFDTQTRFVIRGETDFCLMWVECLDVNEQVRERELAELVSRRQRSLPADPSACAQTFLDVGIKTIDGVDSGSPGFVRINMMEHEATHSILVRRLDMLLKGPRTVVIT